MKKILIAIATIIVVFLCVWKISASGEDLQNKILLAELPTDKIQLYTKFEKDNEGIYEGVILKINNKLKEYDWKNVSNPTFYPELILSDINEDKKKELIIILTTATGTEVHIEDIHIVDSETLVEENIEDPIQIVNEQVSSQIEILKSKVKITLVVNGKEILIEENKGDAGLWFDKVVYENVIHYSVEDGIFRVRLSAQVSPGIFIGDIIVDYYFKDGMYKVKKITFEQN